MDPCNFLIGNYCNNLYIYKFIINLNILYNYFTLYADTKNKNKNITKILLSNDNIFFVTNKYVKLQVITYIASPINAFGPDFCI